ncbi:MAG: metallophosphatase family protein [Muribaculaceae bacterium]|nr:metallophosphatase family protein [Muribaculaceae bacterium]
MKRIGILSDTHGCWDDRYASHFSDCDEIWHAGDIGDYAIIERLQDIVPVVRAVSGNIDHGMVRRKCQELEIFEIEGVKVLLTHIGGYPGKWSRGMKNLLKENHITLMVDGHSHILKIIYDKELELLHINPGAAGMYGWHSVRTLVKLTIDGSDMRDCEVIELTKQIPDNISNTQN